MYLEDHHFELVMREEFEARMNAWLDASVSHVMTFYDEALLDGLTPEEAVDAIQPIMRRELEGYDSMDRPAVDDRLVDRLREMGVPL